MGVLSLEGNLLAGPPTVSSESFPGGRIDIPLRLLEGRMTFDVATGILPRRLASALSFAPLQGVGPTDTVRKGAFLYFKSDQAIDLRITTDDGLGGDVLTVLPAVRLIVGMQFDPTKFLKLLEGKGLAQLEYFICGAE